jgi:hypothetical protein
MTPEVRAQVLARGEASRAAQRTLVSARFAQAQSSVSHTALLSGLRRSEAISAPSAFARGGAGFAGGAAPPPAAAAAAAAAWDSMASSTVSALSSVSIRRRPAPGAPTPLLAADAVEADVVAAEADMAAELAAMGLAGEALAVPAVAAAAEGAGDLIGALEQLRHEPKAEAELRAKFAIFEAYLATVTALRDSVYAAFERARLQFSAGGGAAVERDLKHIDGHANLGADVPEGVWIVWGMMKAAADNHARLSRVLRDMETRLALLAADAECPCCLEPVGEGEGRKPAKVLACAHRTCVSCWDEWAALNPHPFCPLCKQVEFVAEVQRLVSLRAAAGGR